MAWKRGTQNNQAGVIRKGHIKEFLRPSSKDINVHGRLKILNLEDIVEFSNYVDGSAFVCSRNNGLPDSFREFISSENSIYLHAHEHPKSVLHALLNDKIPSGCIALNATQRLNNKVCTGENEEWTVYTGEEFTYDAREGVIGDTQIRSTGTFAPSLLEVLMEIRPRFIPNTSKDIIQIHATKVSGLLSCNLFGCIISLGELYTVTYDDCQFVCRVVEVRPETDEQTNNDEDDDDDETFEMEDHYRGIVEAHTVIYLKLDCSPEYCQLVDAPPLPTHSPQLWSVVNILTSDEEVFPVKRRLLRPCLALTSVVQAGRGKYKGGETLCSAKADTDASTDELPYKAETISIDLDACTFDRVLLYLEHEARGEEFRFDPLIASELLVAAITLKLDGLHRCCERVLGSFQERVRRTPIRFDEVKRRNDAGTAAAVLTGKRSETLLLMSGMVFDITRWLDEHPGGSTIIPNQALNMDCTVFFEIYHASRQSFLYLKEFYIGELAVEDIPNVPKAQPPTSSASSCNSSSCGNNNTLSDTSNASCFRAYTSLATSSAARTEPSEAFLEQLKRVTGWRLKPEDIVSFEVHKSF